MPYACLVAIIRITTMKAKTVQNVVYKYTVCAARMPLEHRVIAAWSNARWHVQRNSPMPSRINCAGKRMHCRSCTRWWWIRSLISLWRLMVAMKQDTSFRRWCQWQCSDLQPKGRGWQHGRRGLASTHGKCPLFDLRDVSLCLNLVCKIILNQQTPHQQATQNRLSLL